MEDIRKTVYHAADPTVPQKEILTDILATCHLIFGCIVLALGGIIKSIVVACTPAAKKNIRDQVALVTGGGNGLGRAISIELAKNGCHVAIADVDLNGAERTAADIRQMGVKSKAYQVDVCKYEEVQNLRDKIEKDIGPVDILINNAGLLATVSLMEGKSEDIQRIIDVNLTAQFWTIRAFLNGMNRRGRGHIVAISSLLGIEAQSQAVCYCSTKFGIRGMMQALAEELRWKLSPVITTTVYPSFIRTRKEFVDGILKTLSTRFDVMTRIQISPDEMATIIIDGLRTNKRNVYTHRFLGYSLTNFGLLPVVMQDMIRDYLKPRITQLFMTDVIETK